MSTPTKILIVDDALFMRVLIKDALYGMVDEFFEAENREQAFELIEECHPDMITLDMSLDSEDPVQGLELLKDLRAASGDTGVIVVSALDQGWLRDEIMSLGAVGYLVKPFDREELRELAIATLRR